MLPFAALAALAVASLTYRDVKRSTLVGPWIWLIIFLASLAGTLWTIEGTASLPTRYVLACMTFCPEVALLGAKRPQAAMWHFVVGTFALIMVLPGLEVMVLQPGQALELLDIRGWFLWLLMAVCWANRIGTRFFPAATCLLAGQLLALTPLLPMLGSDADYWSAAVWCWCVAAVLQFVTYRIPRRVSGWDALWFDYRDRFGLVWSARIRERVNHVAESQRWPFRLTWGGFKEASLSSDTHASPQSVPQEPAAEQVSSERLVVIFANVLRRFLAPEELERRAAELLNDEPPLEV